MKRKSEKQKIIELLQKEDKVEVVNGIKKYSFCKVFGYWIRLVHFKKSDTVQSAMFNWGSKEIYINLEWCANNATSYCEVVRHEIFEMVACLLKMRFRPTYNDEQSILLIEHRYIDQLLGEYHSAIDSLR